MQLFRERWTGGHSQNRKESVEVFRGLLHEIAEPAHRLGGLLLVPKGGSANDGVNGMRLKPEFGDDSKVAATTAYGPKEVLVFLSTDGHEAAVSQHHVR